MRRVVVTGMGIVSSIGNNTQEVLASLREAKSGIVRADKYAELGFRCQVPGAPSLDPEGVVDRRAMRFLGGGAAWNHVAMEQAIRDAGLETGVLDRLLHRDVIPGGAFAEEAHRTPIDHAGRIERRRALHLGAEAELGILFRARDSRLRLMEARKHFLGVVSDGRDNAHPRDDNPPHDRLALSLCSCVMPVVKPKVASMAGARISCSRLQWDVLLEQPYLQILRAIDNLAVHGKPAVSDAQYQL